MSGATPPTPVDLLIRHAYLITMDDAGTQIADGAVAVTGRRISHVGPDAEVTGRVTATRTIDAKGGPIHPGMVETHLHASYQTFRSVVPDLIREVDTFPTVEQKFYDVVTSEDEELAGLLASMEMVRNGTTCFLEAGTFLFPDAGAAAASTVGIRALLGDVCINDQPGGFAQGKEARAQGSGFITRAPYDLDSALAILGTQLARNADPDALVRGHIAVMGLGTASQALLLEAKRLARDAGVVLNMHHAYSVADTDADRARYGKDPVLHLAEIGVIDRSTTLGHANHLTDAETEVLLETGASLAWAPAASMMWGHGGTLHGRHAELWRRGANIGLGSDSANWSNDFDLFRQANLAVLTARDAHEDRTYLLAEDGLRMATRGGARAAGMEDTIGSIEVGRKADLVLHTLDRPEMRPTSDMVRNLVFSSRAKSIRSVVIDGRVVLDDGVFPHLDEPALLARIDEGAHALWDRMGYTPFSERVDRRAHDRA
ncbi:MAG: amidohydrolase family protein [Chloroflexi bacterium]|nr:amidohydrolase family protein [Chloroflexota bacterium]